jgi:hypothetical protein
MFPEQTISCPSVSADVMLLPLQMVPVSLQQQQKWFVIKVSEPSHVVVGTSDDLPNICANQVMT